MGATNHQLAITGKEDEDMVMDGTLLDVTPGKVQIQKKAKTVEEELTDANAAGISAATNEVAGRTQ